MPIKSKLAAASKAKSAGVGLRPNDFIEGGGLYDDFDGTIMEMAFVEFDYDGSIAKPVLALAAEILNDEVEEEAGKNPFIQHYSAGELDQFIPSDDGKEAVPAGSKTGLSNSCNAYLFLMSLIDVGFPADQVASRVDVFEGLRCHFRRQDQPERKGLAQDGGKEGRKRQILLAESLIALPGEEAKPKKGSVPGATKSATKAKPSAPSASSKTTISRSSKNGAGNIPAEVAEAAFAYIDEQLAEGGGSVARAALAKGVFKWAKDAGLEIKERNAVLQAVGNEDWLSEENEHFDFDGDTLTAK